MLAEFAGENETDGGLDFGGTDSALVVDTSKVTGFSNHSFEDIRDEGVHDSHTLLGNTTIGMDLLEDLVNVGSVGINLGGSSLLLFFGGGFNSLDVFSIAHGLKSTKV